MDSAFVYELIGYLASVLIAVSLMMRSVLRLRVINLIGAATFLVYGLLISAYPIAVVNGVIVGINLYYLREMRQTENYFTVLESHHDASYLQEFLRFYEDDIQRFFPSFSFAPSERDLVWFILRDLVPVGLFVAEPKGPDTLRVHLDYVIPGYRDLQPGKFLYEDQAERFESRGIKRLETIPETKEQREYVERMGFTQATPAEGEEVYRRDVR